MRNIIPNTVTVSEQFHLMGKFTRAFDHWYLQTFNKDSYDKKTQEVLDCFEQTYGIKCKLRGDFQVLSPTIVDEKKYLLFALKYQ